MKPTEEKIAEAMTTIRELCISCDSCGECALFAEDRKRCILRITHPAEWKTNNPPETVWRAIR